MHRRYTSAALAVVFGIFFGAQMARADIYTWTDASGRVNVSNIAPPQGVRVTSVVHEDPEKIAAQLEASREAAHQYEVQALADRVRQLEREIDYGRRPMMAPPMPYPIAPPSPPLVQNIVVEQAPPAQTPYPAAVPYWPQVPPIGTIGCDPMWISCGAWLGPQLYSTPIIVVRAPGFKRGSQGHGSQGHGARPPHWSQQFVAPKPPAHVLAGAPAPMRR